MRYQLIAWDFDGTLANSMALLLETCNEVAARHGFKKIEDPDALRKMGARAFLKQQGVALAKVPFLINECLAAIRSRMEQIRLFEGMPELLHSLKASGCRQGILSSNTAENIRACLRANAVEDIFDFVVGYPRLFGKARAIRRLLKKEKIDPQHFLYIGDEVSDVEATKRSGVDVAAVSWGLNSLELLSQKSPTYLWSHPDHILPALFVENQA